MVAVALVVLMYWVELSYCLFRRVLIPFPFSLIDNNSLMLSGRDITRKDS